MIMNQSFCFTWKRASQEVDERDGTRKIGNQGNRGNREEEEELQTVDHQHRFLLFVILFQS